MLRSVVAALVFGASMHLVAIVVRLSPVATNELELSVNFTLQMDRPDLSVNRLCLHLAYSDFLLATVNKKYIYFASNDCIALQAT